jgi:hypothetical protein
MHQVLCKDFMWNDSVAYEIDKITISICAEEREMRQAAQIPQQTNDSQDLDLSNFFSMKKWQKF